MTWTHTIHYAAGGDDQRTFKDDAEAVRYAEFIAEYRKEIGLVARVIQIVQIVNNKSSKVVYQADGS